MMELRIADYRLRIKLVRMFIVVMMLVRVRLAGQMNIELRRRNPAAVNALQAQLVPFDAEFQQLATQQFEIESAIEHRADEHVAARAGETIQIKRSCYVLTLYTLSLPTFFAFGDSCFSP